jgi:anti-sigma factor RsiW
MTTDSQFDDYSRWQLRRNLPDEMVKHTNKSTGAIDMVKRDRFELLSAYLDGEVTAAERRQVEEWLADDAAVQSLYARLLKLRQGLLNLPIPESQQSPETTVNQVLKRLRRRSQLAWTFGGAAIAACVIGAVSGLLPNGESMTPQLAQQPQVEPKQTTKVAVVVPASPLMVALNNPVIEIPKAAVAAPEKPVSLKQSKSKQSDQNIN